MMHWSSTPGVLFELMHDAKRENVRAGSNLGKWLVQASKYTHV